MDSLRDLVIRVCGFLVFGGMLFMLIYITFLVIRGAMQKPGSGTDEGSNVDKTDEYHSTLLSDRDRSGR